MVELGMVSLLLMLPFRKNETMKEQIRSQGVFMQHLYVCILVNLHVNTKT